jgi:hypothetical protein
MFGSLGRILDSVVSAFQTNGRDFREALYIISALVRVHDKHADQRRVCGQRPKQPPFRGGSARRDPTEPRLRYEVRRQGLKSDARHTLSTRTDDRIQLCVVGVSNINVEMLEAEIQQVQRSDSTRQGFVV